MGIYYIPEPTTVLILGLGLIVIAGMQRFRKRLKMVNMEERRQEIDRRSKKDRRECGFSSYKGSERRILKYRRNGTDRRKKNKEPKGRIIIGHALFISFQIKIIIGGLYV